jgi:hypothetical protein
MVSNLGVGVGFSAFVAKGEAPQQLVTAIDQLVTSSEKDQGG